MYGVKGMCVGRKEEKSVSRMEDKRGEERRMTRRMIMRTEAKKRNQKGDFGGWGRESSREPQVPQKRALRGLR